MNVEFVNPFIEATLYILETTAFVSVKARKPFIRRGKKASGDISGHIELTGEFNGSVVVTFSSESILAIVSSMFGEEMTEMNDEIKDAVGEISNMIAGQVTTKLAEMGKTMNIKLLDVAMGEGHHVTHLDKKPVVVMPFSMDKGDFVIEVCFE